jgi:hypothetical protein
MQSIKIDLKRPKGEYARIFVVSCLHIGAKGHDSKKAEEYRQHVLRTPDTYIVSLGDDTDWGLPMGDVQHGSMMFEQTMQPEEQYEEACRFWLPCVERGKLLWTSNSNHWARSQILTGRSAAKEMNVFLNGAREKRQRPVAWADWNLLASIRVGAQRYIVHSTHGVGAGTTEGAVVNRLKSPSAYIHADAYLRGHHHRRIAFEQSYFTWDDQRDKPMERKRVFGATGCFLRWEGTYAERAGYAPTVRGAIVLELSGKRHDARIMT